MHSVRARVHLVRTRCVITRCTRSALSALGADSVHSAPGAPGTRRVYAPGGPATCRVRRVRAGCEGYRRVRRGTRRVPAGSPRLCDGSAHSVRTRCTRCVLGALGAYSVHSERTRCVLGALVAYSLRTRCTRCALSAQSLIAAAMIIITIAIVIQAPVRQRLSAAYLQVQGL